MTRHPAIASSESLKPHTTFKIGGPARYFAKVETPDHARAALAFARQERAPVMVLGGGSNVLVSDRGFDGLVMQPASEGIEELGSDRGYVRVRVRAAEPWDRAVERAVRRGWWGVENLSHIPGQSGAALVQNIGAYGQQLSDSLESAELLELSSGEVQRLPAQRCGLGYRRSIFNTSRKGEFLILSIELELGQDPCPNLTYRDVKAYFGERGIEQPSQGQIRAAIIGIRDGKFPYPREERGGNAGSFFKNPTLDDSEFRGLEARVSTRFGAGPAARLGEIGKGLRSGGTIKVPAAFLIDICGLRGLEEGRAQVNPTQPLVILNTGGASSVDVMGLAKRVRNAVFRETGVRLDLEPELVGFSAEEVERYLALD